MFFFVLHTRWNLVALKRPAALTWLRTSLGWQSLKERDYFSSVLTCKSHFFTNTDSRQRRIIIKIVHTLRTTAKKKSCTSRLRVSKCDDNKRKQNLPVSYFNLDERRELWTNPSFHRRRWRSWSRSFKKNVLTLLWKLRSDGQKEISKWNWSDRRDYHKMQKMTFAKTLAFWIRLYLKYLLTLRAAPYMSFIYVN